MYPTLIVDDFFEEPDAIVEYANTLEYFPNDGHWPGVRSDELHRINPLLFKTICTKILKNFYPEDDFMYVCDMSFQKINPFHEDKYHIKNRGWIHTDQQCMLGGLIYLNKTPENDTGTSLYKPIGFPLNDGSALRAKEKLYTGNSVSDEEYETAFSIANENFEETVTVQNRYNRLLMFNNKTYHGAKTYGSSERLTMTFFFKAISSRYIPPTYR